MKKSFKFLFFGAGPNQYDFIKYLENSDEISIIKSRKQPNWLPPQPFLNLGIFVRLLFERMIAKNET